jgi:hypothetical protein
MKARPIFTGGILFSVVLAFFCFVVAGCKSSTKPKIDWNARVGNYTYDQAVTEMGPPDKSAKLSDGKTVAEWIKRDRRGGVSIGLGTGGYLGGGTAVGGGVGTSTGGYRERILQLTFGADGKLLSWSKNY